MLRLFQDDTLINCRLDQGEGGGASAPSTSAASQGAASQAPAPTTSASSAGGTGGVTSTPASAAPSSITSQPAAAAGAAPVGATPAAQATVGTPATPEFVSIRDVVRNYGAADLADQFQDEHALLQHLLLQRAQAAQYEPWVRQLQQHQPAFQEFLRQQQAVKQQQDNKPWFDKYWQPPEFNRAWERLITRDANGNLTVVPGADPSILAKYQAYQQFRSQAADRLLENPYSFFEEPIKQLAQQMARQEIQSHLGGYKDQQFAEQFTQSNPWLYQRDQAGNPIADQRTGQRLLSREGEAFRAAVEEAQGLGVQDVRAQQKYALAIVQRDFAVGQLRAAPPQTPAQQQAAANQQFLSAAGAAHQGNVGPATSPAPALGNPAPLPGGTSVPLHERMMRNFAAAGYQAGQAVPMN